MGPGSGANNIRQYMSYKIVSYALMKHINNDSQINVPQPTSVNPCSGVMKPPQRLSPDRLPDPWLLDTESLLSELARVRGLARALPNDKTHDRMSAPTTTVDFI
jgi:hypothetical protein